jgi:hypothetical protein
MQTIGFGPSPSSELCHDRITAESDAMSTVKSPQDKKRLSLELDCRNTYGENAKSSRKNISRGKQRSHMEERRGANIPLLSVKGPLNEDAAVESEINTRLSTIHARREGFKKRPDVPLGTVLQRRQIMGRKCLVLPTDSN